eukprot:Partr_v1_DN24675_c1_g1_i2_m59803 putative Dna repair
MFQLSKADIILKNIGYGSAEKQRQKSEAFEKAKKEAVTDAMKRCLKDFGNALGNCVYDKEYLKDIQRCKTAPKQAFDESVLLRPGTEWMDHIVDFTPGDESSMMACPQNKSAHSVAISPILPIHGHGLQHAPRQTEAVRVASNNEHPPAHMQTAPNQATSISQGPPAQFVPPTKQAYHRPPPTVSPILKQPVVSSPRQVARAATLQQDKENGLAMQILSHSANSSTAPRSDIPFDDMDESLLLSHIDDFNLPGLGGYNDKNASLKRSANPSVQYQGPAAKKHNY